MTQGALSTSTTSFTSTVKFQVLGPVTVVQGTETLPLGGAKQRAVLAVLISRAGSPVSADQLVEAVYGEEATAGARRTIQTYVSNLRSVVGDAIQRRSHGWVLNTDRDEVDAFLFGDLYASASEADPEAAGHALREALALWRGHPYADVEAHGYLDAEVTRLNEQRVSAQAARVDADLAMGHHSAVIGEIEAYLAENPYQERFRAQHMLALYRAGRQKEALTSYATMRSLLVDELGVDPTPELQELEQRILEQDPSLAAPVDSSIHRRAVLVADPGDPIELARLSPQVLDEILESARGLLSHVVNAEGGDLVDPVGTASYAIFGDPAEAAAAAHTVAIRGSGDLRMAIDWGDIEVGEAGVSGPPVSRAARLVAAAHPGQVLLSPEAQRALTEGTIRSGMRFEALGEHPLRGLEAPIAVFQLLVGDPAAPFPPLVTDRNPPPLPGGPDRNVPGYELREPIGRGSIGSIYKAYQPSVGREVVVEVISRAESSDADFIRRFEADVQRLSLMEHPHILPILDYWRDTEGAFIVYPYHRGGGLQDSIAAIDADRAITQIGSALAYAHSYGLVHGRLAPNRVVLDESGNTYLYGFPIGGLFNVDPEVAAYAMAETIGDQPTTREDVYSLAVLAETLRTGAEPDPDVPGRLEPDATTVEELLSTLFPETDRPEATYTESRNPYKGLSAFHESDAGDFYGRAPVVAELVQALKRNRLLAVVGPSGIGKSSVVRAGLIPALRNGAITGSDDWLITDFFPGSRPFRELERALERIAPAIPTTMRLALAEGEPDALMVEPALWPFSNKVLLLIDQFEELFTLSDPVTTSRFLALLQRCASHDDIYCVVTLRADFLDRPLRYSGFGETLRTGLVTLRSLNPDELSQAINRPLENVGIAVDDDVAARMVAAVHDQPGALPHLQHALTQLFEIRETNLISVGDYEKVGGVTGALARKAEEVIQSLGTEERGSAKQIFLRLLTIADDGIPTRRRVRVTDLEFLRPANVLDAFTRARLLVSDSDPVTRQPTIEIAHEALLSTWPRLASWIHEHQGHIVMRRRLAESAREWQSSGESQDYLLTAQRLSQHEEWTTGTELTLTSEEQLFLEASKAWNQQLAAEAAARTRRSQAAAMASAAIGVRDHDPELGVLLAIESAKRDPGGQGPTALAASLQQHRALFSVSLESTSPSWGGVEGGISPDGSLLAISNAGEIQIWEVGDSAPRWTKQAEGDLGFLGAWFTSTADKIISFEAPTDGARWRPGQGSLIILDAESGALVDSHSTPPCTRPHFANLAQNGPFIDTTRPVLIESVADESGKCGWFDNPSLLEFDIETGVSRVIASGVTGGLTGVPTMSSDKKRLAYAQDGPGAVLDLTSNKPVMQLPPGLSTINKDGTLVLASIDPLELWDVESKVKLREFPGNFSVAWFSDDESIVYGATFNGFTTMFDLKSGRELIRVRGQGGRQVCVQLSTDGTRLGTSSADATVTVWNTASMISGDAGIPKIESGSGQIPWGGIRVGRERIFVARGSGIGGHFISAIATTEIDRAAFTNLGQIPGRVYAEHPNGRQVAIQTWSGQVELSDEEAGGSGLGGKYERTGLIQLFDLGRRDVAAQLPGPRQWFYGPETETYVADEDGLEFPDSWQDHAHSMKYSHDGRLLAMGGDSGYVAVWSLEDEQLVWALDTQEGGSAFPWGAVCVEFSPDDQTLVVARRPLLQVFRVGDWQLLASRTIAQPFNEMRFTSAGKNLVAIDWLSEISFYEPTSLTLLASLRGHQGGSISDLDIDPSGTWAATAGNDGETWIWDIMERRMVRRLPLGPEAHQSARFLDEQTILIASESDVVGMTLDVQAQLQYARSRITRTFTPEECATYNIDPCPTLEEIKSG